MVPLGLTIAQDMGDCLEIRMIDDDLFDMLKPNLEAYLRDKGKDVCLETINRYTETFIGTMKNKGIGLGSIIGGISSSVQKEIIQEIKEKANSIRTKEEFCSNPRCMPCLINRKLYDTSAVENIKSRLEETYGIEAMRGLEWLMSSINKVSANKKSTNNELAKQAIVIQTVLLIKCAIADDLLESRAELIEENERLRKTIDMLATIH